MIEWVPIREFLNRGEDEDEEVLFYDKIHTRVVTSSIDTLRKEQIIDLFTHAAKINFPKKKTLAEKFEDWFDKNDILITIESTEELAQIAKQHYEEEE